MAGAKVVRPRAEGRTLRVQMRSLGFGHRDIATEFARRYNLRPRTAWREAHGWNLNEAAERINTYAARATGLTYRPIDATVTATWPWLCTMAPPSATAARPRSA